MKTIRNILTLGSLVMSAITLYRQYKDLRKPEVKRAIRRERAKEEMQTA